MMTFEGKPCIRCGSKLRQTSDSSCVACRRLRDIAKYSKSKLSRSRDDARSRQIYTRYRMSLDDWDQVFAAQGKRCAICFTTEPVNGLNWCVDHDHRTGAVRGILCPRCNSAIGFLNDDAELLARAADYIKTSEACPGEFSVKAPARIRQGSAKSLTADQLDYICRSSASLDVLARELKVGRNIIWRIRKEARAKIELPLNLAWAA